MLAATNDLQIERGLCCRLSHPVQVDSRIAPRNAIGFVDKGDVAQDWYEATHQYRFERLNKTEVRITRLADGETKRIQSNVAYIGFRGRREMMSVDSYVQRRAATFREANSRGKLLFGDHIHQVTWYGGRFRAYRAELDVVWSAIESKTRHRKADHQPLRNQLSQVQLKRHLVLPVDDFDDETAGELSSPLVDDSDPENPETLAKRRFTVDWRVLFPLNIPPEVSADDVLDRRKPVDPRGREAGLFGRSGIVIDKVSL